MSLTGESQNYYEILRLARDAPYCEIKRSFMEVAQACHPLKNPTQITVNQARFNEVCEAYDVLSQSKRFKIANGFSAPESHL